MELAHLTPQRIEAWARAKNLSTTWNNENELYIPFEKIVISIQWAEPRLRAIGVWRGRARNEADVKALTHYAVKSNSEKLIPKSYVVQDKNLLAMEYSHLVDGGMSDEQLDTTLSTVVQTIISAVDELETEFPALIPQEEA